MKAALATMMLIGLGVAHDDGPSAPGNGQMVALATEGTWTARISRGSPGKLHLNVSGQQGHQIGVPIPLVDLGLEAGAMDGPAHPVSFALRRESGTIAFTGTVDKGTGQGRLRYEPDPAFFERLSAMGVQNDLGRERASILALPLLDLRSDYVAALRHEGALAPLSDYIGMKAVGVAPELVHEVRPLIAEGPKAHDLMAFAALGITPAYARDMRTAYSSIAASDLNSLAALGVKPAELARFKAIGLDVSPRDAAGLKALNVTPDYVESMRAAGARIQTAGDAQSFRALGISPAAVKRTVARGKANPTASDVMQAGMYP